MGSSYAIGKSTIAACIHQDQTLTDGQTVKLRLLEPLQAGNIVVPKRTALQETVLDAVRSYNEVVEIGGKATVRTVYALPKFTIPDDKTLLVELYEKNGGRHQTVRVENADIVNAEVINELKIK